MSYILKLTLYLFILYPLLGYLSFIFLDLKPYFISTSMIMMSFLYKVQIKSSIIFPTYLKYYLLYAVTVFISTHIINRFPVSRHHLAIILLNVSVVLIFLIIENSKITSSFIKRSSRLIFYLIIFAAVVSFIQYFRAHFFINTETYLTDFGYVDKIGYERRVLSIFTWGDFMNTSYMAIGFIIFYGILVTEMRKGGRKIFITVLTLIVIFLSQYRVAYLTFLIMTLALYFRKIMFKPIIQISFVIVAMMLIVSFLQFNVDYFVEERLASESALTRIDAVKAFFYAFPQNPFFGTGGVRTEALFQGYGHVAQLHNGFLAILFYYGILASIFHTLFIVSLFKKTLKTARTASYWPPFIGMICYVAGTVTLPGVNFYIPGLIFMMVFNKYYYDKFITDLPTIGFSRAVLYNKKK